MMNSEQAAARANLIRKEMENGTATPDELDWLWQYDNGYIITID